MQFKTKIAARAVIIHDGKLLVVKHHGSSFYALPGGKREPGESLKHTLQRELEEELGISGAIIEEMVCVNEFQYKGREDGYSLELFFRISNPEIFLTYKEGTHTKKEIAELSWIDDFTNILFQPAVFIDVFNNIKQGMNIQGRYLSQIKQ